jgi:predicted nuclease of predicted toxin-antitoxin system
MKIKLDENLPHQLAPTIITFGHDVDTVQAEHLVGRPDEEIWAAAQKESRFLITQDLDFSDARKFSPGSYCGLLLLRLHNPSRSNLVTRVLEVFREETMDDWMGCFVVVTERKIRVAKPQSDGTA